MPMPADPLTEERFEQIVAQLRAARPQTPESLRARVRAAATGPPPARRGVAVRSVLRGAVPALAVVLVAAGAVVGVRSLGSAGEQAAEGVSAVREPGLRSAPGDDPHASSPAAADAEAEPEPAPFAPAPPGRLQEQHLELGLRVADLDALSEATAGAMAVARNLGGYVVAAHYAVPSLDAGDSTLVLRVPVSRVQEALARLTALGTIVSQEVRLQDLQPAFDRRAREIGNLRTRIVRLERELAGAAGEEERARLRAQLAAARRGLQTRLSQQQAAEQRGRLARIELSLTTRDAAAAPAPEDGAAVTLRAAAALLGQILVWLGAAAIVAGPFVGLGLLALVAARVRRRALQARLLERA